MQIALEHIGRRFNREWIFKDLNVSFEQGRSYAILGPNGSGKSTLLQIIAGSLTPSEGTVRWISNDTEVDTDAVYQYLSLAAPYMELIEEFTLEELIDFHFRFKNYLSGLDKKGVIDLLGFDRSKNKLVRHFSSGMKQRTKLALAFCSDTPVLLLDEPASNLDSNGIEWYMKLVNTCSPGRTVIICSNQEYEYTFCTQHIHITNYKHS